MRAYKYKVRTPNKQTVAKLENHLFLCAELYNAALQERRDAYKLNRVSLNYFDQANQLVEIKEIRDDLNDVHSQVLQDILKRVDKTFKSFFARIKRKEKAGFPRFKPAKKFDSFCFPQSGFKLNGDKLTLSKIGSVRLRLSRPIEGKIKTCTIKREVSGWFVVFTVENEIKPLPKTNMAVGLDAGIESFVTLSDGSAIDNFKYYESTQKKLRIAQRRVSRRKKGSNQRRKAVNQLRKVHGKIQNQRNDFQHQTSTMLVKQYDLIAIEDLNIVGLSKGILSKQVHDVAWSEFFSKLKYKAENADKMLIKVQPHFTSQDCSRCGNRVKKDLSVRVHHCLKCGLRLHRDHNAAKNILNKAVGQTVESVKWNNSSCLLSESQTITVSV
jgi:putative transposase